MNPLSWVGRSLPNGLSVLEELGATSDGTLNRARNRTGQEVGLLIPARQSASHSLFQQATRLRHLNLAAIHEIGEIPGPLAQGVAFIPYRVENLRILPVGGSAARDVSPRIGHLHITVDDLPWQWADFGQSNTVILVGVPRGQHTVLIEVVDPEGKVFTKQTVTFDSPGKQVPE